MIYLIIGSILFFAIIGTIFEIFDEVLILVFSVLFWILFLIVSPFFMEWASFGDAKVACVESGAGKKSSIVLIGGNECFNYSSSYKFETEFLFSSEVKVFVFWEDKMIYNVFSIMKKEPSFWSGSSSGTRAILGNTVISVMSENLKGLSGAAKQSSQEKREFVDKIINPKLKNFGLLIYDVN